MLLLIGEEDNAIMKGECEAVVVELCGITPGKTFSFAVSKSTELPQ